MSNPLVDLGPQGQSVWYDSISRSLITSGDLARLIAEDGVRGMTSNPAIFEKAISGSDDYTDDLARHAADGLSPLQIYEAIAIGDIQAAADELRPVYDATQGADGYVSLEVSPHLADDVRGTIDEAQRLAQAVDRPNLMIKVPGTAAGIPAVEALIGKGLNINITLLFAQANYAAVADAPVTFDERVGEVEVRVDDGLATAWMPYRFYAGDRFSHCGVNAMQFVRYAPPGEAPRWRIVQIIDTRRTTCA